MDDPTFQNILKQAYNYDIYKSEWESSKLLRDFIGLFARYCSEYDTTFLDMIYQNPNIINFFYYNPNLMNFFMMNPTYFAEFINNESFYSPLTPSVISPHGVPGLTDIYQTIYNSGSILADYLDPSPNPVDEFSCIGIDYHLDILLQHNAILSALVNQNYNNNIYYLSLYNNENLVTLLSNTEYFNKLSAIIQSNPNILNFLSQNNALVLKLLADLEMIDAMVALPNIGYPKYDLNVIFYQSEIFRDCILYPPSFDPLQLCTIFTSPTTCGNANVIIDILAGNFTANVSLEGVAFGNLSITGNLYGNVSANIVQFLDISTTGDNFTNSSNPSATTTPLQKLYTLNAQISQGVYDNLYNPQVYSSAVDGVCGDTSDKSSSIRIRTTAPFHQYISGVGKIYIRTLNLLIPDLFRLPWSDPTKRASVSKDDSFSEGKNTVCPYFYYKETKPPGYIEGVYNKQCLLDDQLIKSLLYFSFTGQTTSLLQKYPPFDVSIVYANPTYPSTNTTIPIAGQASPFHLINFMTKNMYELKIPIRPNNNMYKFDTFVQYFYRRYSADSLLYQLVYLLQQLDISYEHQRGGRTICNYTVPWDFTIAGYYDTQEIKSDYPVPNLKQSEMVDIHLLYQRYQGTSTLNYAVGINSVRLFYSAYTPDSYRDFLHVLSLTKEVLRDVYLEFSYASNQKVRYIQPYMRAPQFDECKATVNRFLQNKINLAMKH